MLLSRQDGRKNPGARLAGIVAIADHRDLCRPRAIGFLLHLGGEFSIVNSNPVQSALMVVLMFLSMALNFGFLLMAIDRLRNEVADLALLDDLTGVGNRRHLLAAADRGMRPLRAQRRAVCAAGDRSRRL